EQDYIVDYDEAGSIGKRYLRAAEAGTPYCITIDYDSKEKKEVTIRDRDSEKQIKVPIKQLRETINKLFKKELAFEKAGKPL
ncbi:MAG: His/Gly/Thr/Pro-type tRNA ligase C-terminal domain-containing protein, partial [Nanoarchaeota archaeon]|nr:His/Gly/Thr/Pro-type tRNA ligase C-terminal domain-containing protein [Nanoarchaeota archaeon]